MFCGSFLPRFVSVANAIDLLAFGFKIKQSSIARNSFCLQLLKPCGPLRQHFAFLNHVAIVIIKLSCHVV